MEETENMGGQMTIRIYPDSTIPENIQVSAATIRGSRKYQEDSIRYLGTEEELLGIVCDGMGGKARGELASSCAIETMTAYYQDEEKPIYSVYRFFKQAILRMDREVSMLRGEKGEFLDCGTTVVAALIRQGFLYFMSVGDSKLYLYRRGTLYPLTREHNYKMLLDEELQEGELSEKEYEADLVKGDALISYLGMNGIQICDISRHPIELVSGDVVILCSDGLYKALTEEQIANIVEACEEDFSDTASVMIRTILEYVPEALDNTSLLCMRYMEQKMMR